MKLYDSGVYLVNGTELVADDAQAAAAIKSRTGREVAKAEAAQILGILLKKGFVTEAFKNCYIRRI